MKRSLIVVAKWPVAGEVKTRLCPPLTLEEAAGLYECFLLDSFDQYRRLKDLNVIVSYFPPEAKDIFASLAPNSFDLLEQGGGDLGEKFIHAFDYSFSLGYESVAIMGSDHPTLPLEFIQKLYDLLERPENDVVIGPSLDGGYYALGLKSLQRRIFQDINWSTSTVFAETLERANELSLSVGRLTPWYDVDDLEGLKILHDELKKGGNEKSFKPKRTMGFLLERDIAALLGNGNCS